MLNMPQPVGDVPLDAIAFCDLIARILYRCLKDQKAHMLLFSHRLWTPFDHLTTREWPMVGAMLIYALRARATDGVAG